MRTRFSCRFRDFRLAGWGLVFLWCLCSFAGAQVTDDDPFAGGGPDKAPEHRPGLSADGNPSEKRNLPNNVRVTTPAPAATEKAESPDDRARRLLRARVDVVFEGELREGLEALGRAVGVPVEIVQPEGGDEIDEAQAVLWELRGCTAEGAIEFFLARRKLSWAVEKGHVAVFDVADEERWMRKGKLPIEGLLKSRPAWISEEKSFDEVVDLFLAIAIPTEWELVDGQRRPVRPAGLEADNPVLTATPATWRKVNRLAHALETALAAKPPVCEHPFTTENAAAFAALEKRVTIDAEDMPLHEFLAAVECQVGAPINLDRERLEDMGIPGDTPITFKCRGLRSLDVITRLFRNFELNRVCHNGTIILTSDSQVEELPKMVVFDIGDLTAGEGEKEDAESLIERVVTLVMPATWGRLDGGVYSWIHLGNRSFFVISGYEERFADIASLFEIMRRSRRTGAKVVWVRHEETTAMRNALGREVTWKFRDVPLSEAVETIAKDLGIPVYLDQVAFDDMGIGRDTPLSLPAGKYTARDALARIIGDLDLVATLEYGGLTITPAESMYSRLQTAAFDVTDLVAADRTRADADLLVGCLTSTHSRRSWEKAGGWGSLFAFPTPKRTTLVVHQTQEILDETTTFLDALRDVRHTKARLHVVESPTDAAVRKAIAKEVDWSFDKTPLPEAINRVAADLGISVYIDQTALDDPGIDPDKVFLELSALRRSAKDALRDALEPHGLDILIAHGGLAVTTTERAEIEWKTAVYNVTDLTARTDVTLKSLANALRKQFEPETWDHLRPLTLPDGQTLLILAGEERLLEKVGRWLEEQRGL